MANLPESAVWEAGIYQLEETDPVQGGPSGIDNLQAKQLASRTVYLKQAVETLGTGKQPIDATLTALAALNGVADRIAYFTAADTFALTPLTAFIRTLLDDGDASAARLTLGAISQAQLDAAISSLVNSSPALLDTLNELAAALGNDPNFATTIANAMALKASIQSVQKSESIISAAGGTADAITAAFNPAITVLTNGMTLYVRAAAASTTPTPTFTPAAGVIAPDLIVKGSDQPLAPGDIAGPAHWLVLQRDSTLNKWVLLNPANGISGATPVSAQSLFKNLQLSAGGTAASISVSYDELVLGDGMGGYVVDRAVAGTITTTITGAGGLDTGALAGSTWYSIWRIGKPDGTRAFLFSLSATAPTMPAGYTLKARLGWFRTDASNKYPLSFVQRGRRVQYKVAAGTNVTAPPSVATGIQGSPSTPTWVAAAVAAFVPSTAGRISLTLGCGSSGATAGAAPNNAYGAFTSNGAQPPLHINTSAMAACVTGEFALEGTNVYYYSANSAVALCCIGWEDNL